MCACVVGGSDVCLCSRGLRCVCVVGGSDVCV